MKKNEFLVGCSILILLASILIEIYPVFKENELKLDYNYINLKDIAATSIATKKGNTSILKDVIKNTGNTTSQFVETALPLIKNTNATVSTPTWRLPTVMGNVSQYPSSWHFAYDITSPRSYSENVFPIANGVISGIYRDSAGALIVTVYHNINGVDYTSQYVHLSYYAQGLYVGKPVTVNDSLGLIGSTGRSTGPHLHIAVLDCHLFDSNDPKCPDLNGFFRYGRIRYGQGFRGLGSLINVPGSWENR